MEFVTWVMARVRVMARKAAPAEAAKKIRLQLSRFIVSPNYTNPGFVEQFRSELKDKEPFPHWQLRNFLDIEPALLSRLHDELVKYKGWNRKENDLYSLYQTPDLKLIDGTAYPTIRAFWQFLCGEMKEWLANTSGIELLPQVDATGSCYGKTDCLLPHSDQVENRRFAFAFYLTDPWSEDFGGNTNIYNCDDNCDPTTVSQSLSPSRNSLLLFEVSEKSWHSVTEVIGDDHDPRLSINGWFHTNRPVEPRIRPPLVRPQYVPIEATNLSTIFNEQILSEKFKEGIKKAFGEDDQLLVKLAFQDPFRNEILEDLNAVDWIEKGPVNKRWMAEYDIKDSDSQGPIARFVKTLRSQTMMNFVKELTGFEYQDPHCTVWAYRLTPGCYTVLGDEDAEQFVKDGVSTDFWFYFGKSQWDEEAGGSVVYIKKDQEEPVLVCPPTIDAFAVVHREKEMFPFVKYVNRLAGEHPIYVFGLSLYGGIISGNSINVDNAKNKEDCDQEK